MPNNWCVKSDYFSKLVICECIEASGGASGGSYRGMWFDLNVPREILISMAQVVLLKG